ncbi:MAG: DUF1761 domain-containing protein [Bacteroidales bacterium]|nr:DUF1761 domain-containing protein [Bacteroidales bacterium]
MDLTQINYWAVLVAALSSFVIGSLWYASFLFGRVWMRESGMTEEKVSQSNMFRTFGLAFLLSLIIAFNLAAFLGPESTLAWGIMAGALAGIGWVAASTGINYLYESKSLKLFLINGGYQAVSFMVMGGIIGVWH